MNTRKFLVGLATGISCGYLVLRAYEAAREVRRPSPALPADAAAYGRRRRALALSGILRSTASMAAFAFGGGAQRLDSVTRSPWRWLRPVTFTAAAQTIDALLELPVEFVEGYTIERRYGMTEQASEAWLSERVKEALLGIAISSALAGIFGAIVRRYRAAWPYLASAGAFPLFVLANVAVPLWIMPLFNRFEPLTGPLEKRLRELAAEYGCGDADILRVDMSRQTKKANAYVTGIGSTHRIVVGDTLLEHFTDDEIAFVVAHELGHYVSKDSWRLIGVSQAATTILLVAASTAVRDDVRDHADNPRTLLRIFFWISVFSQIARPAICSFSRSREWAADRFAVAATGAPHVGAQAFTRLREQNLAEDEQPAWYEFFFSTHPSLKARIALLEADRR
ncbi:MAG TPA: M48 family metallopeptidase [Candidatus Baltobacteraceae bacterium]|jgi:STE24 endopeptidase